MANKFRGLFRGVAIVLTVVMGVNLTEPATVGKVSAAEISVAEEFITEEFVAEEIAVEESVVEESVVEESVVEEIAVEETVAEEIAVEKSIVEEIVAEESEAEESVVEETAVEESVAAESIVEKPVVTSSVEDFQIEDGVLVAYTGQDSVVQVPDTVTAIGNAAFANNTTITSLYLGKNVTSIGENIVRGCTALTAIGLPDGDTEVAVSSYAFSNCNSITTIEIGVDVVSVNKVFLDISTLENFHAEEESTYYYSEDGVLFYRENSTNVLTLVRMPRNSAITDYSVPGNCYVTAIGEKAFENCKNLVSVQVPEGVKEIKEEAFQYCTSLETVDMGPDVAILESYVFYNCKALDTLKISASLEQGFIGSGILSGTQLKMLEVPQAATYIPEQFMFHSTLGMIVVEAGNSAFTAENGVLYTAGEENADATGDTLLAYPRAKEDVRYSIPEGTKTVGDKAFNYCTKLVKISIPDSLEKIGYSAFEGCTSLTDVVLGKNVSTLDSYAFYNCDSMGSLTLSEALTAETVGSGIISACDNLTVLYVPKQCGFVPEELRSYDKLTAIEVEEGNAKYFSEDGVLYETDETGRQILLTYPRSKADEAYSILEGTKEIGDKAFNNCKKLVKISMPDSLEKVGYSAFEGCTSLTDVVLGKNVSTLDSYAFYNCDSMGSLTLSEALTAETVGSGIISACDNLTTVYVPATCEHVPSDIYLYDKLQNIYVINAEGNRDATGTNYASEDGILYNKDKTALIRVGASKDITEYVIPDTVTRIEDKAVIHNKNLTVVTIPEGVNYIGASAFEYCSAMQLIMAIGCNPEKIGSYALDSNDNVIIMCDPDTSVLDHAVYYKLIYMSGQNKITVKVWKKMTASETAVEDSLRNYKVTVYLGENGGNEQYEFPAYSAGDFILIPEGKQAENGDTISGYDVVTVRLKSKSGECADSMTVVALDENKNADIEIQVAQRGYVTGAITAASNYTVSLYDSQGNYITGLDIKNDSYVSEHLEAGNYSIVVLQGRVRNWIQDTLSAYDDLKMVEGIDYVKKNIQIVDGEILVQDIVMPQECEYASAWVDADATSYQLVNSEVTSAGLMNFRLIYSLKKEFAAYELRNKEIIITMPESITVYERSVMENGEAAEGIEVSEGMLKLDVTENSGIIQFSATPTTFGEIISSATLCFTYEGVEYQEYLDSISTSMDYITIHAPERTTTRNILVYGVTVPGSEVRIYDGGNSIGTATAYASGKWSARVNLSTADTDVLHNISASVKINGETKTTKQYEVVWSDNVISLTDFNMYYDGNKYIGEGRELRPSPITWKENSEYTFLLQFENSENIKDVYISTNTPGGENRTKADRIANGYWMTYTRFTTAYGGEVSSVRIDSDGSGAFRTERQALLPGDMPPSVFHVEYVMKEENEVIEQEVADKYSSMTEEESQQEKAEMPDMWKNATAQMNSDTRDTNGYGVVDFDVTLANTEQTTLNYRITSEHNVAISAATLEADADFVKTLDEAGRVNYTKYYYEETFEPHIAVRSVINVNQTGTTTLKMGSITYRFTESDKAVADVVATQVATSVVGTVSSTAGGVATVIGVYTDVVEVGNNFVSLASARASINGSNLSAADKAARNAALDKLMMGYMVCAALRYGAVVIATGLALSGAPFMVGLVIASIMSIMNTYVNQTLSDALFRLTSFHPTWIIDPSGYVYEAVESNRIEGATATVYYKGESGEAVLWNAEEYDQVNPQITGRDGIYAWDVPIGEWKVIVEKEGYETAESEWLPVPPPQTDVNIRLIPLAEPETETIDVYSDRTEVIFSQYMDPSTVSNITLSDANGNAINYMLSYDTSETDSDGNVYAKVYRLIYDNRVLNQEETVTINVPTTVISADGKSCREANFGVDCRKQTTVDTVESITIVAGETATIPIIVENYYEGSEIKVSTDENYIINVETDVEIDANGTGNIVVSGEIYGKANIIISCDKKEVATIAVLVNSGEEVPEEVTEKVTERFKDVLEDAWYVVAVQYAYDNNIMSGTGDNFEPEGKLTREQFTQVLYSNSGKPAVNAENKFVDVEDSWYTDAVLWANENNIASGIGDGFFGVGANITREQLALMLYKYAMFKGFNLTSVQGKISQFADGVKVSSYAIEALDWAITQGIISGKGNPGEDISTYKIDPQGTATRAECAAMMRMLLMNN